MTFRNQRHGEFMDESSIFLELNGLSSSGMALGKVLGFARDDKTKTHQKHKVASNHLTRAKYMACEAINKVKYCMMAIKKKTGPQGPHYYPVINSVMPVILKSKGRSPNI